MSETTVISLGGSIISPEGVDTVFVRGFRDLILRWLARSPGRRAVIVTGGGAPARVYQKAYREIEENPDDELQDWIGVAATRLNGSLIRAVFRDVCADPVVTDPTAETEFRGRVLVAAGWKPGFSSDFDAVMLAERFGASTVLNLSNIPQVYTADPKLDPSAEPIGSMSWTVFRALVGDKWVPGKNVPFDPIAARKGEEIGLTVVIASGRDIDNTEAILENGRFTGTVIGAGRRRG